MAGDVLRPKDIAAMYGVSRSTVQRWTDYWIKKRILFPINYNPVLRRQPDPQYYPEDIERVMSDPKNYQAA